MITYERQEDGTLKQVDSPPKRAESIDQRIYDRCIVRVGQLEAEKVTLEERIDELCAENERLRQENQSIGMAAYELGRASMADENAKLRELLDYMTPIAWYAASERERDRMRELGIEVPA